MAESGNFSSKSFAIQAQKKVLGKLASKNVAKVFVDDTTSSLFDQLYAIAKRDTGNKKEAEKLLKDLIKIAVKIGVLYRNNQFTDADMRTAETFRSQFKTTAMTIVSFHEVDFTYDRQFLIESLEEAKKSLHSLIESHLTQKSHGRVDHVFNYFSNGDLLDKLFQTDALKDARAGIADGLNKLMENGDL
ncbi:tumor necrosis factor alpha-induced protein 8-like protein 3 [Xenia sp. Carnegie-2017]|uniref:tumor necrosis factor alpha-induced protein 8-like protein 3 n=1 Tax=Xenia sp. Carnegie-2017 TaxID=2897299 RepID=UPI001F04308E|nr:tumor necrosis factor alpha-induced protein 8-like protein 3 [Xenia sp. Carnegie-2017]